MNWLFYIVATLAAMATTMAEFLGGVLGFYLLFGIPLSVSVILTAVITFIIVYVQKFGQRVVEIVITLLVAIICGAYILELFLAKPEWPQVALHTLVPSLPGGQAVLIAAGMLGATVMPHVIYLHSDLTKARRTSDDLEEAKKHFRMERFDIVLAMNVAFLVNAAMVVVAASVFFNQGPVDSIEQAHRSLAPLLGNLSSGAFGMALLASGLSSSTVGAMAGECMLNGFMGLDIPINVRRAITIIPAIVLLWLGFNPMKILIMSQVTLSFALPAAIIPLLLITKREDIMGPMANHKITNIAGTVIVSVILTLNMVLLYLTFMG
jgi:manganese transport protein